MKKLLLFVNFLVLFSFFVSAQDSSSEVVILRHADDLNAIMILDPSGEEVLAEIGASLHPGYSIRTGYSTAELEYRLNKSIIRLEEETLLKISGLQESEAPHKPNRLSLFAGTIRTVAARIGGNRYALRTPSAGFGVRGTDFILSTEPLEGEKGESADLLTVFRGKVEAYDFNTEKSYIVEAGQQLALSRLDILLSACVGEVAESLKTQTSFTIVDPMNVPSEGPEPAFFNIYETWADEAGEIPSLAPPSGFPTSPAVEASDEERPASSGNNSSDDGRSSSGGDSSDRGSSMAIGSSSSNSSMSGGGNSTESNFSSGENFESSENGEARGDSPADIMVETSSTGVAENNSAGMVGRGNSRIFLMSVSTGYGIFPEGEVAGLSDGGIEAGISVGSRLFNIWWLDTGLKIDSIFCFNTPDSVENMIMVPVGLFGGIRYPLTELFYFGGQAEAGIEMLSIVYDSTTNLENEFGLTPYGSVKALAGLNFGTFSLELQVGLVSFYDEELRNMIPLTLVTGMGLEL